MTPLGWEHISLTGDYVWADEAASARGAVRVIGAGRNGIRTISTHAKRLSLPQD